MNSLTSREREIVLILASGGLSNKDVGRRLNLSEGTVKVHLHNIYNKLELKNRTALVALALGKLDWIRTGAAASLTYASSTIGAVTVTDIPPGMLLVA
jgi:DNA-binding CsgD family transcriptional regulator